jgi:type II secretory pathway pseudopilin PulG
MIEIDCVSTDMRTSKGLKRFPAETSAFSLVEVTLALGVAAFCAIVLLGLLPAGLKTQQSSIEQTTANTISSQIVADLSAAQRLPPGLQSKQFNLHGRWAAERIPDILYFAKDGTFIPGSANQNPPPPEAVFMAAVTYLRPPTETTSLADVTVGWPAAGIPIDSDTGQPDFSKAAGKIETFSAINR